MTTILTFMFLGWFFWPFTLGAMLWAYCCVCDEDDDFNFGAGTLIAIGACAILYRYDALRDWLWSIEHIIWTVAGYAATGFILSLYKWLGKIHDFRRDAPKAIKLMPALGYQPGSSCALSDLRERCNLPYNAVKHSEATGYYLDWRKYPIANWWTYWPLFFLGVALDPVRRGVIWAVDRLKQIWDALAKQFAVK